MFQLYCLFITKLFISKVFAVWKINESTVPVRVQLVERNHTVIKDINHPCGVKDSTLEPATQMPKGLLKEVFHGEGDLLTALNWEQPLLSARGM